MDIGGEREIAVVLIWLLIGMSIVFLSLTLGLVAMLVLAFGFGVTWPLPLAVGSTCAGGTIAWWWWAVLRKAP